MKKKLTNSQLRDMTREFFEGSIGTRVPVSSRNLISESSNFRMPSSYYDPPDYEEIPDEIYQDVDDIFERAARSPSKRYTFKGHDGDYVLIDETETVGDALPLYTLRSPNGREEDFYLEEKQEIESLEDRIADTLMQVYIQNRDEYDRELRADADTAFGRRDY